MTVPGWLRNYDGLLSVEILGKYLGMLANYSQYDFKNAGQLNHDFNRGLFDNAFYKTGKVHTDHKNRY